MNLEEFESRILKVLEDSRERSSLDGPFPTSSSEAKDWGEALNELSSQLELELEEALPESFQVEYSRGTGYFPYVTWVVIRHEEQSVSDGVYVAICFDHRGRGLVAGVAKSATQEPDLDLETVQRTPLQASQIDVDSPSDHGSQAFNDVFHNPKEFQREDFDAEGMLEHLRDSIALYKQLLRDARYFVVRLGSDDDPENPEVRAVLDRAPNPFSVSDIYTHRGRVAEGDVVFITLGGGKTGSTPWTKGLAAVGVVDDTPQDVGYKTTKSGQEYYRLPIRVVAYLPEPLPLNDLRFDPDWGRQLREAPMLGPNRVNQAIAQLNAPDEARAALSVVLGRYPDLEEDLRRALPPECLPAPSMEDLSPREEEIRNLLLEWRQVILYGPPGTGKTYSALRVARSFSGHDVVVFHPSYSYEDFIGGIRPRLGNGDGEGESSDSEGRKAGNGLEVVEYEGVFQNACDQAVEAAEENPTAKFVLVIDEINRGDIARIFGELLFALERDKRGIEVSLPYKESKTLTIPDNLLILGTMNSTDRSIALLDVALRRRFAFMELEPEPALLGEAEVGGVRLAEVLRVLNERLTAYRDRDHRIGHAYFMDPESGDPVSSTPQLMRIWQGRIEPLIREFFYGDPRRMHAVLGDAFVEERALDVDGGDFREPPVSFELKRHRTASAFRSALKDLVEEDSGGVDGVGGASDEPTVEREELVESDSPDAS